VADGDGIDTGDRRDPANEENAGKRSATEGHGTDYRTERSIANPAKNVYGDTICMMQDMLHERAARQIGKRR